jgi:hypothetical protein
VSRCSLRVSRYLFPDILYYMYIDAWKTSVHFFVMNAIHNKLSCTCGRVWTFRIATNRCNILFKLFSLCLFSLKILTWFVALMRTIRRDWSQRIMFRSSRCTCYWVFLPHIFTNICVNNAVVFMFPNIVCSLNIFSCTAVLIIYFHIIQLWKYAKWETVAITSWKHHKLPYHLKIIDFKVTFILHFCCCI